MVDPTMLQQLLGPLWQSPLAGGQFTLGDLLGRMLGGGMGAGGATGGTMSGITSPGGPGPVTSGPNLPGGGGGIGGVSMHDPGPGGSSNNIDSLIRQLGGSPGGGGPTVTGAPLDPASIWGGIAGGGGGLSLGGF